MSMKKWYIEFAVVFFACSLIIANAACDLAGIAKTGSNTVAVEPGQKDSTETGSNGQSGEPQAMDVAGKYVYKTHREGKGGFENLLEITSKNKTSIHVSFSGTYFYMAGPDETFHEGEGEGDGILNGNTSVVTFSGDGGSCKVTLTFEAAQATAKSSGNCGLNVDPNGIYKKESTEKKTVETRGNTGGNEVCPDPAAPCKTAARGFANYEMPFRLPAKLKPNVTYKSARFYAVILKTYDEIDCDADDMSASVEKERRGFQTEFRGRKVFASYDCPDMDALGYDFPGMQDASGKLLIGTFVAVYAGKSESEAKDFLAYVRTMYDNVQLKQMTESYEMIEQ